MSLGLALNLLLHELGKGARAVAQPLLAGGPAMLHLGRHLTKGQVMTIGHKHRVIAMALIATWRPDQGAKALTVIDHVAPVRMSEAKRGIERALTLAGR